MFAETNELRFNQLLWALITHCILASLSGSSHRSPERDQEAGRNVAHSFRQSRSKLSVKFTNILILGAMKNILSVKFTNILILGAMKNILSVKFTNILILGAMKNILRA